jgi:hypothetical protein
MLTFAILALLWLGKDIAEIMFSKFISGPVLTKSGPVLIISGPVLIISGPVLNKNLQIKMAANAANFPILPGTDGDTVGHKQCDFATRAEKALFVR